MTAAPDMLTLRRPDDWHLHFRDGEVMQTVVPYTSATFARAIVIDRKSVV